VHLFLCKVDEFAEITDVVHVAAFQKIAGKAVVFLQELLNDLGVDEAGSGVFNGCNGKVMAVVNKHTRPSYHGHRLGKGKNEIALVKAFDVHFSQAFSDAGHMGEWRPLLENDLAPVKGKLVAVLVNQLQFFIGQAGEEVVPFTAILAVMVKVCACHLSSTA